ncbi:MAG: DUF2723 domain-containing protein [Melioribacteraceae bacterium]|nr:DUF2723 domain-containing protein [Melioribacteraceae bacterium]
MKSVVEKYSAAIVGLIIFAVYLQTISPGLSGGDCGELAAVQTTMGIAHPTGYPLFTILGYLFTKLPISLEPIQKLNLLAAVYTSLGMLVFYIVVLKFLKFLRGKNQIIIDNKTIYIVSIATTFILAFSPTIWFQSTFTEVYSLHILLVSFLFYLIVEILYRQEKGVITKHMWLLVSICLAFSFGNHFTTVFLLPGFLYLYIIDKTFKKKISFFILSSLVFLVLTSSLYSYLLIRSSMNPVLNWGDPDTLRNLINHITASDYSSWFFPGMELILSQSGQLINSLFSFDHWEFNFSVLFAFAGIIVLPKSHKGSFIVFLLILLVSIILSNSYFIPDINNYFISIFYVCALFISVGIVYLLHQSKNFWIHYTVFAIIFISVFVQVLSNFNKVNKSEDFIYDEYARTVLLSTEPNSIVLVDRNTPFYFPSLYLQKVEKLRTDVAVICIDFQQSWYFDQIKKDFPDLVDLNHKKFIVDVSKSSVFISPALVDEFNFGPHFELVPLSLLFKVNKKDEYLENMISLTFSEINNPSDPEINSIIENIAVMYENRAKYELRFGRKAKAAKLLNELEKHFPDFEVRLTIVD